MGGVFAIYLQQFEKQNRSKFPSIYFVYILASVLAGMYLLKLNQLTPVKYLLLINMMLVCFYYLSRIIKAWPRVQNLIKTMSHLTFSSYLIHFPVQIILTLFFGWLNRAIPFYNISFLTLFLAITFGVSYLSYYYFEKPLQVLIRNKFKYS
ncbi:hypothetical protein LEPN103867_08240 [Legionella pneumophila subsp. pneumophila]|nr:Uncharacterised protein [Legionella pneumophila]